jgi:hypothetical protein
LPGNSTGLLKSVMISSDVRKMARGLPQVLGGGLKFPEND